MTYDLKGHLHHLNILLVQETLDLLEPFLLSQSLITKCIGTVKSCGEDLQLFRIDINSSYDGNFFAGLDFAKHQDYSVFALIEDVETKYFLRYLKIWPHEVPYASVIGWIKVVQDRVGEFRCLRAAASGVKGS